jgi:hypothetical protein
MDSAMIGKIEKAKRYAEERDERITFSTFSVVFRGENSDHTITFDHGKFTCDCNYFHSHSVCQHTMAMERILGKMLKAKSLEPIGE